MSGALLLKRSAALLRLLRSSSSLLDGGTCRPASAVASVALAACTTLPWSSSTVSEKLSTSCCRQRACGPTNSPPEHSQCLGRRCRRSRADTFGRGRCAIPSGLLDGRRLTGDGGRARLPVVIRPAGSRADCALERASRLSEGIRRGPVAKAPTARCFGSERSLGKYRWETRASSGPARADPYEDFDDMIRVLTALTCELLHEAPPGSRRSGEPAIQLVDVVYDPL